MPDSVAEQFDPYYKWLAIPPDQQPPDHYRLLGIRTFEDDREVIAIAADRQMAHVKTFAVGKYSQQSQKLLGELAKAKLCLLNATKKSAYDSALLDEIEGVAIPSVSEATVPTSPPPVAHTAPTPRAEPVFITDTDRSSRTFVRGKQQRGTPLWVWCFVALLLAAAGVLLIKMRARYAEHVRQQQAEQALPQRRQSADANPHRRANLPKPLNGHKPTVFRPIPQNPNQGAQALRPPNHQDLRGLLKKPARPPQETNDLSDAQELEPQLTSLPAAVELPPLSDDTLTTLCTIPPETKPSLISIDDAITLTEDYQLAWRSPSDNVTDSFATLHISLGELQFRWDIAVPKEAEAALRNCLLVFSVGDQTHTMALRMPATAADELSFDLVDNKFAIKSPAEFPPPAEAIRFQLLGIDSLPPHAIEGADPASMAVEDECVLRYARCRSAWTTISMKKTGKVATVSFVSMYELPSGREIPMSINKGNAEGRTIERELQNIANAKQELPRLKTARNQAQNNLSTARRRNNLLAAGQLQTMLGNLDVQIAECNRLIATEPAVRADQKEQLAVTELAQQLQKISNLPYRFYIIVDGHEVDLIRTGNTP
jgi:hypothetical protein